MSGRTGARPRIGARRSRSLALLLSALLHVVVLGWFALKRGIGAPAVEAPPITVELVRIRPQPQPAASSAPSPRSITRPSQARTKGAPEPRVVNLPPGPGRSRRGGVDLYGPVFADGIWPRPAPSPRTRCDPRTDPERTSPACRREDELARGVTRAYDPQNGRDDFAREARHNEAVKRYHEAPGTAGYPGIGCQVLHRC